MVNIEIGPSQLNWMFMSLHSHIGYSMFKESHGHSSNSLSMNTTMETLYKSTNSVIPSYIFMSLSIIYYWHLYYFTLLLFTSLLFTSLIGLYIYCLHHNYLHCYYLHCYCLHPFYLHPFYLHHYCLHHYCLHHFYLHPYCLQRTAM